MVIELSNNIGIIVESLYWDIISIVGHVSRNVSWGPLRFPTVAVFKVVPAEL